MLSSPGPPAAADRPVSLLLRLPSTSARFGDAGSDADLPVGGSSPRVQLPSARYGRRSSSVRASVTDSEAAGPVAPPVALAESSSTAPTSRVGTPAVSHSSFGRRRNLLPSFGRAPPPPLQEVEEESPAAERRRAAGSPQGLRDSAEAKRPPRVSLELGRRRPPRELPWESDSSGGGLLEAAIQRAMQDARRAHGSHQRRTGRGDGQSGQSGQSGPSSSSSSSDDEGPRLPSSSSEAPHPPRTPSLRVVPPLQPHPPPGESGADGLPPRPRRSLVLRREADGEGADGGGGTDRVIGRRWSVSFEGRYGGYDEAEGPPRERAGPATSRGPTRPASPGQSSAKRVEWDEVRVVRSIGTGATAEVFEAEWRGQRVAAKCFTWRCEEFTQQEIDRFRGEAAVLERLRHPGLPRLLALGDRPPHLFLLTDLCPGGTLADALRRGRFEPREAAAVGAAVARALAYLHGLEPRVCHRDVKPENVLLGPDGEWRLVDFGSAVELQADNRRISSAGRALSVKRRMGEEGSFYYVAPEVVRDEPADERVDLYALGMLLYELATGRRPFEGTGMSAIAASLAAAVDGLRPPLHEGDGGAAAALAPLIRACWHHTVDCRPTAAEAARRLGEIAGHGRPSPYSSPRRSPRPPIRPS